MSGAVGKGKDTALLIGQVGHRLATDTPASPTGACILCRLHSKLAHGVDGTQ